MGKTIREYFALYYTFSVYALILCVERLLQLVGHSSSTRLDQTGYEPLQYNSHEHHSRHSP